MARMASEFDVNSELRYEGLALTAERTVTEFDKLALGNHQLPIYEYKDLIVDTIDQNPVTIISAQTGTGKSTQVPQYLLATEAYSRIYVSQPRRPAARGVFDRIKYEITDACGIEAGEDWVGFQTAVEKQGPDSADIKIVTDGLQLVHEFHGKGASGRDVLIIDEAHECNSNIELLLAWSKMQIKDNPSLRLVLMSAKMDTEGLADYFEDAVPNRPPILEIPGKTYDVEVQERPYSTVSDTTIELLCSMRGENGLEAERAGDTLVFLPGKREIQEQMEEVARRIPPDMRPSVKLFPLHSKLSPTEQDEALREYPGFVRVIFSTDIAESSLTVPGLRYVIDAGLKRQPDIDHEGTKGLRTIPATKASITQRMGRVGRTSDGTYILTRLNEETPYVRLHDRDMYPVAEILLTDVQRSVLRLNAIGIEMKYWDMLHDVSGRILELADVHLVLLDAAGPVSGAITPMGRAMNRYPLCTSSARIMVEAAGYPAPVRSYLAAMTAAKEVGGLQFYSRNASSRWREFTEEERSDLLVQLDLFVAAQGLTDRELREYGFDVSNVHRAREQYAKIAKLAAASSDMLLPPTPEERDMILECSLVGFMPAIYSHQGDGQYLNISNEHAPTLREISNRSRVGGNPDYIVGDPWRVELTRDGEVSEKHLIHNVTTVTPAQLGRLVAKHVVWRITDYKIAGSNNALLDKVHQVERAYAFGTHDLSQERHMPPEPSYALRARIIEESLKSPGAEQRKLRELKKQLQHLARIAKDPVPQFSQDMLEQLIHEAAPHDITNPATIEDNLRLMSLDPERAITLDQFVSPERLAYIQSNAPSEIMINDQAFAISYKQGKPRVRVHDPSFARDSDAEHVYLKDGREVFFLYHNGKGRTRRFTLGQLRLAAMYEA